jgi:hypothetical protein
MERGGTLTREDLMRLEPDDLLKSRVFAGPLPHDSDALPDIDDDAAT